MSTAAELKKSTTAAVSAGHFDQDTFSKFIAEQRIFNGNHFSPKQYLEYIAPVTGRCENGLQFDPMDIIINCAIDDLRRSLV